MECEENPFQYIEVDETKISQNLEMTKQSVVPISKESTAEFLLYLYFRINKIKDDLKLDYCSNSPYPSLWWDKERAITKMKDIFPQKFFMFVKKNV